MLLIIVMATVVAVGLVAIGLAQPPGPALGVWNDETERRLLRERTVRAGWW